MSRNLPLLEAAGMFGAAGTELQQYCKIQSVDFDKITDFFQSTLKKKSCQILNLLIRNHLPVQNLEKHFSLFKCCFLTR